VENTNRNDDRARGHARSLAADGSPNAGWHREPERVRNPAEVGDQADERRALSKHILPSSGTMIGVCATLIGLVKLAEAHIGPSRVDEYAALASLLFLASAIASYISIRHPDRLRLSERSEAIADQCFLAGLIGIAIITLFFAYEVI
jgi:hypothetical protein